MKGITKKNLDNRKKKILDKYCKEFPEIYKTIEENIKMYNNNCPKVSFSLELKER